MFEDTPAAPVKEVKDWTTVDQLKTTRLGSLIQDLHELTLQKSALEAQITLLREAIAPLVTGITGFGIQVQNRRVDWYPESSAPGDVNETKLVSVLGLTKEEVDKCREKDKKKKAYFKVTKMDAQNLSETPADGLPTSLDGKS